MSERDKMRAGGWQIERMQQRFQRKSLFANDPFGERMERIRKYEDKKNRREQRVANLRALAAAIENRDEALKELLASADLQEERVIDLLVESGVADSIEKRIAQDLEAFVKFSELSEDTEEAVSNAPSCSTYIQLIQLVVFLNNNLTLAEVAEMRLFSSDFLCSFRLLLNVFVSLGSLDQKCYVRTADSRCSSCCRSCATRSCSKASGKPSCSTSCTTNSTTTRFSQK